MREVQQPKPEKLSLLDRGIGWISPRWAAKRVADRKLLRFVQSESFNVHRGASTTETRGNNWLASKLSPDSALEEDLETLRDRSRELYRNNATVVGLVDSRVSKIIEKGLRPQARIKARTGLITEAQAERWNTELEEVHDNLSCSLDFNGLLCEPEIMRQIQRNWDNDGDVFVRFRARATADKPVPLALEVIPGDRVATPIGFEGDPSIRLGIKYNAQGQRIGYYILKDAPGDSLKFSQDFEYVEAFDPRTGLPNIVHLYEQLFPGQSRGVPLITPVLPLIKDLDDLREAVVIQEQIRACFAAFIKGTADPLTAALGNASATATSDNGFGGYRIQNISPGRVEYLSSNQDVAFADPGGGGSQYKSLMEWCKLDVAAAVNWPYSWLTKDYRSSTYSSERMALIDGTSFVECRQQLHIVRLWQPFWKAMVRQAVATGEVSISNRFYRENRRFLEAHEWIPPGIPWIDPYKDAQAAKLLVDENFDTRSNIIARSGLDPERVMQVRSDEKKWDEQWGITPVDQRDPVAPSQPAEQPEPVGAAA